MARIRSMGWVFCLAWVSWGCAPSLSVPVTTSGGPQAGPGLVLDGRATGPLPGMGPQLDLRLWAWPGRSLRAELGFETDRGPVHEVLVWTPRAAVLFDRRHLRYTRLSEEPGHLDAFAGTFAVGELWWLLLGDFDCLLLPEVEWRQVRGEWRGRGPRKGYRRPVGEDPGWTEVIWRDLGGEVHRLRAHRLESLGLGGARLATAVDLEGTDLPSRVRLRFDAVRAVALGDSILDPVWEPPPR